mgnify:FL=1
MLHCEATSAQHREVTCFDCLPKTSCTGDIVSEWPTDHHQQHSRWRKVQHAVLELARKPLRPPPRLEPIHVVVLVRDAPRRALLPFLAAVLGGGSLRSDPRAASPSMGSGRARHRLTRSSTLVYDSAQRGVRSGRRGAPANKGRPPSPGRSKLWTVRQSGELARRMSCSSIRRAGTSRVRR